MATVTCYECGKKYNYAEDGFCPRCGSFNQPRKGSYTVGANGDIVRVDGINEAAHEGSFVHKEYHAEERQRKKLGLDRTVAGRESAASAAESVGQKKESGVSELINRAAALSSALESQQGKKNKADRVGFIVWLMVILVILLNLIFEGYF